MNDSTNTRLYGEKLDSEKNASENATVRDIVKEINIFGINERQRLFLIYLLALEIENASHMRDVTTVVREIGQESKMFLSDMSEDV